jgi:cell fate regulator YaaT (PSP1 superfamily)
MPIHPLPQFEADVEADRKADLAERLRAVGVPEEQADRLSDLPEDDLRVYKKLAAPKTLVVRYGFMKMVGEFPYRGKAKPGCGSKMVVTTHRGTEIGEMLTSTCPNSGCSKSVSRKEMLEYIENSGGRQYPFRTDGKVLRVATAEDMDEQARVEQSKHAIRTEAKRLAERARLPLKIVDAEPILGDERLTIYYTTEDKVDFRGPSATCCVPLHRRRVDVRQVGARDEARITADYEKCGQYCCCKNFLKVLKPVSMRSAKIQKATLDPLKISGRCGRLMCCLRYEDETYDELRKKLPNRKKRVGTPEGDGIVIDTQILTQLALVRLDSGEEQAIPVEELTDPEHAKAPEKPEPKAPRLRSDRRPRDDTPAGDASETKPRRKRKRRGERAAEDDAVAIPDAGAAPEATGGDAGGAVESEPTPTKKKRRRRRRRRSGEGAPDGAASTPGSAGADGPPPGGAPDAAPDTSAPSGDAPRKKRRRRRRRKPGGGDSPNAGNPPGDGA